MLALSVSQLSVIVMKYLRYVASKKKRFPWAHNCPRLLGLVALRAVVAQEVQHCGSAWYRGLLTRKQRKQESVSTFPLRVFPATSLPVRRPHLFRGPAAPNSSMAGDKAFSTRVFKGHSRPKPQPCLPEEASCWLQGTWQVKSLTDVSSFVVGCHLSKKTLFLTHPGCQVSQKQ